MARKGTSTFLDAELLKCIQFAISTLASAQPRRITAWKNEWPVLIFTDGACEGEGSVVTHGAVLCDQTTASFFYFGDHVPGCYVQRWQADGKRQVIYQAELFPVWIAKRTWRSIIVNRQVLWFLDNEAARAALIRSYSPLLDSMQLVRDCAFEMSNLKQATGMHEWRQSRMCQTQLRD